MKNPSSFGPTVVTHDSFGAARLAAARPLRDASVLNAPPRARWEMQVC